MIEQIRIAAIVALVALSATVWAKRRGVFELPQEKVDRMEFKGQREKFDEWISQGSVSGDGGSTEVRMESLEGVVDVAIDSNRRVTQDGGSYIVLVDGVRYVFKPDFGTDAYSEVSGGSSSSSGSS